MQSFTRTPQQLALLLLIFDGYHREMQLAKAPLVEGLSGNQACLGNDAFQLIKIEVPEKNITDDSKYDYLFSVDTLNEWVKQGIPFRESLSKDG